MSTDIYKDRRGNLSITKFWGGPRVAMCIQITGRDEDDRISYVQLNRKQVRKVVEVLTKWLEDE